MKLRTIAPLFILAIALVDGAVVSGCGSDPGRDTVATAAAQQPAYAAEQKKCVDVTKARGGTIEESRACRCEVQRRWQCPDLGGCTACVDGGS